MAAAYRLAPEHPFPAARDDALTVWRRLRRDGYAAKQIAVGGDSAGANLTLALVGELKRAGEDLPGCLWLLSPWVDLTMSGATLASKSAVDPLIQKGYLEELADAYVAGGHGPEGPAPFASLRRSQGTAADPDSDRLGRDLARRRRPLRRRGRRGRRLRDPRNLAAHDPCLAALERAARAWPARARACGRVLAREPVSAARSRMRLPKPLNAGTQILGAGPRSGYRADDLTTELNVDPETPSSAEPRSGLLGNPAFMVILIATSLSSVGLAMFDTGSAWMMTSLNPSPRLVSAVQVATTLPLFLLTLPAGALTDVVDPRRLLIVTQTLAVAISVAFAAAASAGLAGPTSLLTTSFLMGMCGALAAPAWLLITTLLVRTAELDSAIAIDTAGYNVARAIGPAIAGYAIARLSIAVPFWCCCVGNLALLAALIWWRAPRRPKETLPAERLISAMTTGVRYVRYSREMDATLIRAIAFFPFASAYLALLPLVARSRSGRRAGGLWPADGGGRRRLDRRHIRAQLAEEAARRERAGRAWRARNRRLAVSPRRGA